LKRIEERLNAVVAEAIERQLDDLADGDESEDQRVQRLTADQLVRDALASGQFGDVAVAPLRSFRDGNTALLVARIETTLTFVVKVDRSPGLVAEAHHLRHASTDPNLPEKTRRAFPKIYAIDDVGPIFGYLMENLEEYSTFASALSAHDVTLPMRILEAAWTKVLAPAYLTTRQRRIVPNVAEDYFVRAEGRLLRASELGHLPACDESISIRAGDAGVDIADGWGPVLEAARTRVSAVAPPFSTFVHGDPNPENVLWRVEEDGEVEIRLIDPKDWRNGDYLFDAAKIGHYLRVTSPVERQCPVVEPTRSRSRMSIEYGIETFAAHAQLEKQLLRLVAETAEDADPPDCASWRERYDLALAANLLGIAGPRLERGAVNGEVRDTTLGWIAFAEGLRLLASSEHVAP
jgi:hypothetical protein